MSKRLMERANHHLRSGGAGAGMTRRNLAAAVAALVAGASTRSQGVLADPPGRKRKRRGHHCFLAGTRIATPGGEVSVEHLQVGDLVVTHGGKTRRIVGIGRRVARKTEGGWSSEDLPVLVRKSALCDGVPHRDLYVSKGHALYCDGMLIPSQQLINHLSVVECWPSDRDELEYVHIDVGNHDVVYAEGAPCETLRTSATGLVSDFDQIDVGTISIGAASTALFATIEAGGYRQEFKSRLRSAISPLIDVRTSFDRTRDRIEQRAISCPL